VRHSSNCCGRHTRKAPRRLTLLDDEERVAPLQPNHERALRANRRTSAISPPEDRRDILTQSLEGNWQSQEADIDCFGARRVDRQRSLQFDVAREQRRRAAGLAGGLGDALDVRPRPVWARRRSRRNTDNGNYERAYRTSACLDVLADAAPLEGRRRAAQSALPAAGRCRRSVPGALPRREDAGRSTPRARTCPRWPLSGSHRNTDA
jgi:hypothetical protein